MIDNTPERSKGLHGNAIRVWAMLFLALGVAGKSIIQNQILGLQQISGMQLLEAMNSDSTTMLYVTIALVCQAAETCATPIFALLLVEGFCHTSNLKNYLLRVLIAAAVSEIPYNIAMGGHVLDLGSRNPVFGVALALIMLMLFNRYSEKGMKNTLIKAAIVLATIVWAKMLGIAHGDAVALISAAFWAYRKKPNLRTMAGCAATAVCSLFSMYYLMAAISFVFIYMYNGEPGQPNRKVNYAAYPVILAIMAACSLFL